MLFYVYVLLIIGTDFVYTRLTRVVMVCVGVQVDSVCVCVCRFEYSTQKKDCKYSERKKE